MKDPAVLFYTSDFLTGTAFFTDSERGQYIKLLCEQHQIGHIPENHMIEVCGSLSSPVVKKFVKDDAGDYYNERMEEEIIKRQKHSEKQKENIKKRWSEKYQTDTKTIPNLFQTDTKTIPLENENENENRNENIKKEFISKFNEAKGTKIRVLDSKAQRQLANLLKQGNTIDDVICALKNAMATDYHIEKQFMYLTPEFITRSDKYQLYHAGNFKHIQGNKKRKDSDFESE